MAGLQSISPALLLFIAIFVFETRGSYVITAPRGWIPGREFQVCVQVTNPEAPAGKIDVSITAFKREVSSGSEPPSSKFTVLRPTKLQVASGKHHTCESIPIPELSLSDAHASGYDYGYLSVFGEVDGSEVSRSVRILQGMSKSDTVIQTDKHLYKPGQVVQFRILTHSRPFVEVSKESYSEVYVTTPSRTRIAQWLDVDNSIGLIHLSVQLSAKPEEGEYTVHVKRKDQTTASTNFKVEEYVMPRFEVTLDTPKYVLASDKTIAFTACAKDAFGQPVKGNITWTIKNNEQGDCHFNLTKTYSVSGCSEIKIATSEFRIVDCVVWNLKVAATMSEEKTGVKATVKEKVFVTRKAISFDMVHQDSFMKPNLPYTLKVGVKLPDGSPSVGEEIEACHGSVCRNYTTSDDGIVAVHLTNTTYRRLRIQNFCTRPGMLHSYYTQEVKQLFSLSNSSLLIYAPEEEVQCRSGEHTNFILSVLFSSVNQTSATVNVQVMSRGQIQYWKSREYLLTPSELPFENEVLLEPLTPSSDDVVTGVLNIPLRLPSTVSPKAKVLVWYVRDDGEVVSDAKELKVEKCLPNSVTLNWSTNQSQPGDQTTLALASEPNSICSLGVVDKFGESLSLQKNSLTIDTFFGKLKDYDINSYYNRTCYHQYLHRNNDSNNADTLRMFDEAGLYVFSDLDVESRPCKLVDVNTPESPDILSLLEVEEEEEEEEGATQSLSFPETWLLDLVVIPSSGISNQELIVPDTITDWVGKAVCMHPKIGVGMSEKALISTFTPFFLDLTLPSSIKRGEILPVNISIFNYMEQSLPVTLLIESSSNYEVVETILVEWFGSQGRRFSCLAPQDKIVHTMSIRPTVVGQVNIVVSAFVDPQDNEPCGSGSNDIRRSDVVLRPITVESDGFLREKSWSKLICSKEVSTGADKLEVPEVSVPLGIIAGTEEAWVTVVGDLLAISLENLGHLIRMPYGCGEQNMLNFAPNIFILSYLQDTMQDTKELTKKLLNFMNKGYQNELRYRHDDGSFSAFGKLDDSGSTWLTAFVLKSFTQAQSFISIDQQSLSKTRRWLLENYGNNSCSRSVGKVYNKGIKQWGITSDGSSVPLTSYVLISLLESKVSPSSLTVQNAIQCLLDHESSDPYTMALKAYALALAGTNETLTLLQQLLQQANVTENSMHWELPTGSSKALTLETASYALLAMMTWDARSYEFQAKMIVRWISANRNAQGGFYSTQDTVVALQAMASYASHLYQENMNAVVQVEANGLNTSFTINESNKFLQQTVSLSTLPTAVSFSVAGEGCAVVQTVLRYYDPNPVVSEAFNLSITMSTEINPPPCTIERLTACASYLLPNDTSNMAIIEVNLVSGYIPVKTDLNALVKNMTVIKRYEIDGSKISFYIDELAAEEVCVTFRVLQETEVGSTVPGSVVVYDYYQPEFSTSETYTLQGTGNCDYRF